MTRLDNDIYHALLEGISDGVLVVDFQGTIVLANSAFCSMFQINPDKVTGCVFGEIFLSLEGVDEFTQAVLDAVYHQATTQRKIVNVHIKGEQRLLSVASSYLTDANQDEREHVAVIACVSDITEIRELRETEVQLTKVVKSQLGELQTAYRDLEFQNEVLSSMTRKTRVTRVVATLLVVGIFIGIGAWRIQPLDLFVAGFAVDAGLVTTSDENDAPAMQTLTITPRPLQLTIALKGQLALGRVEEIVSPFEGHVSEIHVNIGQMVPEGKKIIELDTGQLVAELRRSEVDYINSRDRLEEIKDWSSGAEMARARAALRRAGIELDDAKQTLARATFLLDQGIISALEHEQAERSRINRKLDFEAAERELASVEKKGSEETLKIAQIDVETARAQLQSYQEKLDMASIKAPISGVLIAAEGPGVKPLVKGRPVSQGELLASIADFERLSVESSIDEVDVRKIKVGQRALISGPGFGEIEVEGTVSLVSSRAKSGMGLPRFNIIVDLDKLDDRASDQLRVGMSAHVAIVVYSNPESLMIPLYAVEQFGNDGIIKVVEEGTDNIETRTVSLGYTTLDSVEVINGLAAGEMVVLPNDW